MSREKEPPPPPKPKVVYPPVVVDKTSHEVYTHCGMEQLWWTRYDGEEVCGGCHPAIKPVGEP